jgi:cell wall-associated NlpC family hydrolase
MRYKYLFYSAFVIFNSGCGSLGPTAPAPVVTAPGPPAAAPTAPPRAERSEALLQALLALGLDYRYGGNNPVTGFDCSGLVAHVYLEAWNVRLPRNTSAQSKVGTPVSLAELQAGDLVFYDTQKRPYSHVGIYLGEGKFVHAPKSGAQVRIESLKSTYWTQRFNGARRIDPSL